MNEKTYLGTTKVPGVDGGATRRPLDTLATTATLVIVLGLLYLAREILVPIAIAVLLSFVLSPLVKGLRRIGLGKRLSVGAVVLATFVIAVGLGGILAREIADLASDAPRIQATASTKFETVQNYITNNPVLARLSTTLSDLQKAGAPPKDADPKTGAARQAVTHQETAQQETAHQDAARSEAARSEAERSRSREDKQVTGLPGPSRNGPGVSQAMVPEAAGSATSPEPPRPTRVEIVSPPPGVLSILQTAVGMAATPLATAAFVAIFIIFILMQREDLRNRFIRLVGSSDLQRTTLAMNDAASRLSRFFLAQMLLNVGFGVIVAVALTLIGVPSPILWGIVAAFMRFIPYIGSIGAAFFPILLAAAAEPGWSMVAETAVFFFSLELFVGQIVEPLVYGHHTGISPIAVVASATFWTWLWGPVGLVLSTPMTVCLVVLGRHVERLKFLDVLLGDAPALTPVEIFYQRMLTGDVSETLDYAEAFTTDHSLLQYSDEVAMKALLMAQTDVRRGVLDSDRQAGIRDTMRALADILSEREGEVGPTADGDDPVATAGVEPVDAEPTVDAAWRSDGAVMCFAGRTPLDEAAAHLLADLLKTAGVGAQVEPATRLLERQALGHDHEATRLIVLSYLDADLSLAQVRFAIRRLRRQMPDIPVIAMFWMAEQDEDRLTTLCSSIRSEACASNLPDAIRLCLERARPAANQAPTVTSADARSSAGLSGIAPSLASDRSTDAAKQQANKKAVAAL